MNGAIRLGTKVRTLRRRDGLSQIDLAGKLGISASYLNLIEHNQRPLTAALLMKVAQMFRVELDAFGEDGEGRLAADLQEIFSDPLFGEHPLTTADLRELASNSGMARAVVALYQTYKSTAETTRALSSKLYDGRDFLGLDPQHLPSEEVSDVLQANLNFFPELERAADAVRLQVRLDRGDLFSSLARYLREERGIEVLVERNPSDRSVVRKFDPEHRKLFLSESLSTSSRLFQLAHQIGLITASEVIDGIVSRSHLTTPDSVTLCRVALANYFASAVVMPYDDFLRSAESLRYDIELLGHRFGVSFEQVCHRLTTLRRPDAPGVGFHFVRVDVAGNISKRFSGTGIRFARFSGSCPRWDVHSAFLTPGQIRLQLSKMPDGTAYFCIARTIRKTYGGYGAPTTLMAVGIGCHVREARKLVYADGMDLGNLDTAVPIGTTCRLCERFDCEQRAFPSLEHGLKVDENVRGVSFYTQPGAAAAAEAAMNARMPVKKRGRPRAKR
ncbi:MAG TPA: short-chain fatty acyl-CoA regulator family protein [Thermoanaerobaculia bacterium]|nr:short-chain fatty acyl-CoA regulator family protein [Thermoanaerobaculia bacterium]